MVERRPRLIPSNSNSATGSPRSLLFGKPQFLPGEDAAVYDGFLGRIQADIKPPDVIQEMLCHDLVEEQWGVLRFRGLTVGLIRTYRLRALTAFVQENLPLSREEYVNELTRVLQESMRQCQEQANPRKLAGQCAGDEPAALDEVKRILSSDDGVWDNDEFIADMRAEKSECLVQEYARGERDAITRISDILAEKGVSLESLTADELTDNIDNFERLDQRTTMAAARRNATLREIDRRREMLGEIRPSSVQKIRQGEVKMIEAPAHTAKKAS